jgi:serine/threonine protein kinase
MRLNPGVQLGRYEVLDRIGSGGMGEVYRARDTRLDKVVAIKIVGSSFASDPDAGPRFERERKLTSALDHPHICRLLDAGHENGVTYIAMEYLEGEPLSQRLARGSIPSAQALGYAIELAEALGYAHSRGVIHRDLKPANLYITDSGLKVLDFGLAKLRHPGGAVVSAQDDTARLSMTSPGTLIGSALYMAPERLEGAEADERSDIFSFGLVLYEMLAGRPAFHSPSTAGLIAAVLTADPPPLAAQHPVDEELDWLVRKCLAKAPADRWQSMGDVAAVLKRIARRRAPEQPVGGHRVSRRAAAAVVAVLLLTGVGVYGRRSDTIGADRQPFVVFPVLPPTGGRFTPTANSVQSPMLAMAPDGSALAYAAAGPDGVSRIWIRQFDMLQPRMVPGTEGGMYPFWSPTAGALAFFSEGFLKRVDVSGGPPRVLAPAPDGCGGAWSASGTILFAPRVKGGLHRVSDQGGTVTEQTHPLAARGETSHRWPQFLGAGSHFIYFARAGNERHEGIYLGSLESDESKLLTTSSAGGTVLPPDRLLYLSQGSLVAQSFSTREARLLGDPVVVATRVASSSNFYGAFSAAPTGAVVYASAAWESELAWMDRNGQARSTVGVPAAYVDFRLSPDNRHVAVAEMDVRNGHPDLYVVDLERGTRERITSTRVSDGTPMWSPDGHELLFRSNRDAVHDLYRRAAFGTSPERPFMKTGAAKYPTSWAAGDTVLFHSLSDTTGWDVWTVHAADSAAAVPLLQTRFNEAQAQLSPDRRWIAYISDEDSSFQVYLQECRPGGRRTRISVDGGSDPRWNPSGSELFYISRDGWLTAVRLPDGVHSPGRPAPLFRVQAPEVLAPYTSSYDVARDGSRFLVRVPREHLGTSPFTVVLNVGVRPRAVTVQKQSIF